MENRLVGGQGLRNRWVGEGKCVAIKRQHKDPHCDGNVLYPDCINVSNLAVILYFSFLRSRNPWGKLGQGYTRSLCYYFFKLLDILQLSQNEEFNFNLKIKD